MLQQEYNHSRHLKSPTSSLRDNSMSNGTLFTLNTLPSSGTLSKLQYSNEKSWIQIATLAETMDDIPRAVFAYESAIRCNSSSTTSLKQLAELYKKANKESSSIECYCRLLQIDSTVGSIWSELGHCYLLTDDLARSYSAFQQALYYLPTPKDPKVWYGIGLLYDRLGSDDHAEEAYLSVLEITNEAPKNDASIELRRNIYYKLGCIYSNRGKYDASLSCFRYLLSNPPSTIPVEDILHLIVIVYAKQGSLLNAKEICENLIREYPGYAKGYQLLGTLLPEYREDDENTTVTLATAAYLKSIELNPKDSFGWYLLGRCYSRQGMQRKAYEAYQQAVYRDGRQGIYWGSIGYLYFQIHQYKDALDGYIRSIHLNPKIPQVWRNLGILFEQCNNNQLKDAVEAYHRCLELNPSDHLIEDRIHLLQAALDAPNSSDLSLRDSIPEPEDIHPLQCESYVVLEAPNSASSPSSLNPSASPILSPPSLKTTAKTAAQGPYANTVGLSTTASLGNSSALPYIKSQQHLLSSLSASPRSPVQSQKYFIQQHPVQNHRTSLMSPNMSSSTLSINMASDKFSNVQTKLQEVRESTLSNQIGGGLSTVYHNAVTGLSKQPALHSTDPDAFSVNNTNASGTFPPHQNYRAFESSSIDILADFATSTKEFAYNRGIDNR